MADGPSADQSVATMRQLAADQMKVQLAAQTLSTQSSNITTVTQSILAGNAMASESVKQGAQDVRQSSRAS